MKQELNVKSMYPDDTYLREHIAKLIALDNENPKIDFKRTLHITTKENKAELIKDIIAITNSESVNDPNGYYIIGAHRTRLFDISSLNLDDATLQQIVNSNCHKPIEFQFRQFPINGNTIGVIIVPKSNNRPHHVLVDYFNDSGNKILQKGTIFIRRGSSTDIATREDLDLMYEPRIKKKVEEDIGLKKHKMRVKAPKTLTERYVDIKSRKKVTLEVYKDILREIDAISKRQEVKTKEQFYYEIKQTVQAKKRAKESEKL
jgi:hypothetical protein